MSTTVKLDHNWGLMLYELGLDTQNVLAQANLPTDFLDRAPSLMNEGEYFQLFAAIDNALKGIPFALAIGESVSLQAFPPSMLAAVCSEHLNAGIERYVKYYRLTSPLKLALDINTFGTVVSLHRSEPGLVPEINGMTELVTLMRLLRQGTRKALRPLRITVPKIPAPQALYEDYFGVRLTLGSHYSISIYFEDALRSFVTFNPLFLLHLETELDQLLLELEPEGTITDQVQAFIYTLLPAGDASLQKVSSKMGISARSLQRKLAMKDTSFREILQKTRKKLAYNYLLKTNMTVAEIAFLLGYDEATFFRVFKKWTGRTPTEYRSS